MVFVPPPPVSLVLLLLSSSVMVGEAAPTDVFDSKATLLLVGTGLDAGSVSVVDDAASVVDEVEGDKVILLD
jgi:hypothetical protein